jgi:monomeric isocitrate dehydrogenase
MYISLFHIFSWGYEGHVQDTLSFTFRVFFSCFRSSYERNILAQDVFAKHGELLQELKVNPNNGLGDLYDKIKGHPLQETIEKDIQVCRG